jgi:thiol-disulfide isomerase/thioredoxin
MDCYFSAGDVRAEIPGRATGWTHVVNTYDDGQSILYINGVECGAGNPRSGAMAIERPARMWIGGWYDRYDFVGDIDEVRVSGVARSADWVRLEYENQKPMQTLVGPVVQEGDAFSVSPGRVTMNEGATVELSAKAGGAQKIYWSLVRGNEESVIATDRFRISLDAGRVSGDQSFKIRMDAVYADEVRSIEVPVTVTEALPEPQFALPAPADWDGRQTIEIRPEIRNLEAMRNAGVGELDYQWKVAGLATIKEELPGKLVLRRAQNSGPMTVTLALANGGAAVTASARVMVREPEQDAWIPRTPGEQEMPVEGRFYARDDRGHGSMVCKGTLEEAADEVFLRVFAEADKYAEKSMAPGKDGSYAFVVQLKPGLVKYRIEFGTRTGGVETVRHRAGDIVCGDAYIINGQSNALATDTREESPRVTNDWVRSYGRPQFHKEGERENLWCKPVWKANNKEKKEYWAELGWWGMELANRLVERQEVPVFIINAAQGGTRIDQHQRNDGNPADLDTIYGRMLWRVRAAGLTHGIRAILWHQGENDQGAAGPDGGYGWESYQRYFVEMAADWKRDFPNVRRYYVYQIWPNACSMGAGNGDMLREQQRTLPRLFSNLDILSTVGVRPPGGCHFPLAGWSEFARMVQPLIERDFYGEKTTAPLTAPNLMRAYYTSDANKTIAMEFDQPVVWDDELLAGQFHLDDQEGAVVRGETTGNVLTLTLGKPQAFTRITYLKETSWNHDRILMGKNGLAALTFCKVPVLPAQPGSPPENAAGPSRDDAAKLITTPKPGDYPMLGRPAPGWEVGPWHQLPEGKASLDISDFKGKVLYMYCFQSWCPGCHSRGFPTLQKVSRKYDDDDQVAFVVFQTVFEDRADKPVNTFANLKKIAAKFGLTMPFAQSGSREDKSRLMRAYKTRGTPWTIIVDKKGIIRHGGFHITPDDAAKLIEKLKAE